LREQLALDDHGTSADGAISLRPVYCLGACACSPALELDGQVHARLTLSACGTWSMVAGRTQHAEAVYSL
jgi:NADH:ubiquinone oxidoreductase subunit E